MISKLKITTTIILFVLVVGIVSFLVFIQSKNLSEIGKIQNETDSCAVCINGCNACPEGCDECLIGIEKKLKDPNLKWYYSPDI